MPSEFYLDLRKNYLDVDKKVKIVDWRICEKYKELVNKLKENREQFQSLPATEAKKKENFDEEK